jgi:hypothetical protein
MTTCSPSPRPDRLSPRRSASASASGLGGPRVLRRRGSLSVEFGQHELAQRPHVLLKADHRSDAVGLADVVGHRTNWAQIRSTLACGAAALTHAFRQVIGPACRADFGPLIVCGDVVPDAWPPRVR